MFSKKNFWHNFENLQNNDIEFKLGFWLLPIPAIIHQQELIKIKPISKILIGLTSRW